MLFNMKEQLEIGHKYNLLLQYFNKVSKFKQIGLMSRVFTSGLGDRGSIPGRVIPKTQKWYLMPPFFKLGTTR